MAKQRGEKAKHRTKDSHICRDLFFYPFSFEFDRKFLAPDTGPVDLTDRSTGDGVGVKIIKRQHGAKSPVQCGVKIFFIHRRHGVVDFLQLVQISWREKITSCSKHLAEFDKTHAKVCDRVAKSVWRQRPYQKQRAFVFDQ